MKTRKSAGITLIALVVTVIILLILAGVTLSLALNNNGLISRTKKAVELNEMAKIQEEAEMVKMDSQIGLFANKLANSGIDNPLLSGTDTTLRRKRLMNLLNEHFEGSTMDNIRITTADEKYDIIVRNNLEILVCKHGESYLKVGEMEIFYYVPEEDAPEKTIELYFDLGKDNNNNKMSWKEYAEKTVEGKNIEEEFVKWVCYDGTFDEYLAEGHTTRQDIINMAKEQGMTYDEFLTYAIRDVSFNLYYKYIIYAYTDGLEGKTLAELEEIIVDNYKENDETISTFDDVCQKKYGVENGEAYLQMYREQLSLLTDEEILMATIGMENNYKVTGPIRLTYPDGTTNVIEQEMLNGREPMYADYKVAKNGDYKFTATGPNNEEGEVTIKVTGIQEDSLMNPYNFGRKINYVAKGDNSLIWRLFYANEDWVYLISSKADGSRTIKHVIPAECIQNGDYEEGSAFITNSDLRNLNSMYYDILSRLGTTDTRENVQFVAYMMDQNVWEDYKDAEGNASYVIAGPTLELFRDSFNKTAGYNNWTGRMYVEIDEEDGKYHQYGRLKLDKNYNYGIYNNYVNDDDGQYMWMASPVGGSHNASSGYVTNKTANRIDIVEFNFSGDFRPIAIIPMNKFESAGYHMLDE